MKVNGQAPVIEFRANVAQGFTKDLLRGGSVQQVGECVVGVEDDASLDESDAVRAAVEDSGKAIDHGID